LIKDVISHLPGNISAEDITMAFQETTAKRPTPEGRATNLPPPLPSYSSNKLKSFRNLQINNTLYHSYKRRRLQIPKQAYTMLQLPAFWSHLGELQAAFSLPVVRGWTPP
jgi:hypothetical protein